MERRSAILSETWNRCGWRPPEVMQKAKVPDFFKITMTPHHFLIHARHLSAWDFCFLDPSPPPFSSLRSRCSPPLALSSNRWAGALALWVLCPMLMASADGGGILPSVCPIPTVKVGAPSRCPSRTHPSVLFSSQCIAILDHVLHHTKSWSTDRPHSSAQRAPSARDSLARLQAVLEGMYRTMCRTYTIYTRQLVS
jgi:hypothetical protein